VIFKELNIFSRFLCSRFDTLGLIISHCIIVRHHTFINQQLLLNYVHVIENNQYYTLLSTQHKVVHLFFFFIILISGVSQSHTDFHLLQREVNTHNSLKITLHIAFYFYLLSHSFQNMFDW
jgi:hypothetical protein